MKTILTIAFVSFLAITTSAVATDVHPSYTQAAANPPGFTYFRVHRQQAGAGMMWSVNHPDVSSFKIERSYDGEFFDEVTELPNNGAARFQFTDKEVFAGYIHYRITALTSDGATIQSSVETIRIVARK
jgi:hypothetical protein